MMLLLRQVEVVAVVLPPLLVAQRRVVVRPQAHRVAEAPQAVVRPQAHQVAELLQAPKAADLAFLPIS